MERKNEENSNYLVVAAHNHEWTVLIR
ncbi:hypothetical protein A2U01_0105044, partial [Trifolium medium]|nr:hypothetical protein [Trifolium medium]